MDKQIVVKDLIRISKRQGEHEGRWDADEFNREEECEDYLFVMMSYADDYGIRYGELEDYREFDDDEEFELQRNLGFYLFEKLSEKLMNELL